MHDPQEPHLATVKQILCYLHGTMNSSLLLRRSALTEHIIVYADTDWAARSDTRRSTFGYFLFLGENLVSWTSKRQPVDSRSSADVEYRVVANGVAKASWLCHLLLQLHRPLH
jgi:hypothetical protein